MMTMANIAIKERSTVRMGVKSPPPPCCAVGGLSGGAGTVLCCCGSMPDSLFLSPSHRNWKMMMTGIACCIEFTLPLYCTSWFFFLCFFRFTFQSLWAGTVCCQRVITSRINYVQKLLGRLVGSQFFYILNMS